MDIDMEPPPSFSQSLGHSASTPPLPVDDIIFGKIAFEKMFGGLGKIFRPGPRATIGKPRLHSLLSFVDGTQ